MCVCDKQYVFGVLMVNILCVSGSTGSTVCVCVCVCVYVCVCGWVGGWCGVGDCVRVYLCVCV